MDKKVILSTELVLQPSVSQNKKTVSGIVKDENGEPIIGANVIEKGTANGTVTDMDGKYTLEVSSSTVVLQLSYNWLFDKRESYPSPVYQRRPGS